MQECCPNQAESSGHLGPGGLVTRDMCSYSDQVKSNIPTLAGLLETHHMRQLLLVFSIKAQLMESAFPRERKEEEKKKAQHLAGIKPRTSESWRAFTTAMLLHRLLQFFTTLLQEPFGHLQLTCLHDLSSGRSTSGEGQLGNFWMVSEERSRLTEALHNVIDTSWQAALTQNLVKIKIFLPSWINQDN